MSKLIEIHINMAVFNRSEGLSHNAECLESLGTRLSFIAVTSAFMDFEHMKDMLTLRRDRFMSH